MTKLIRPKEAQARLGIGHSKFWQDFVASGRLRPVRIGPRSVGILENELDALIAEMVAKRDATSVRSAQGRVRLSQREPT